MKNEGSRLGFDVAEISPEQIDEIAISSTKIRNALSIGDVAKANEFLDKPYSVTGIVVKGNQIGKTLGFPTANIKAQNKNKLIPAFGIYAVKVKVNEMFYDGMLYIGDRPTIDDTNVVIAVSYTHLTLPTTPYV